MTLITLHTPAQIAEPRGARIAVEAVLALCEAVAALRRGLARHRAYRSRAAEAAQVRAIARETACHDPRVAAELYAAADRHERG